MVQWKMVILKLALRGVTQWCPSHNSSKKGHLGKLVNSAAIQNLVVNEFTFPCEGSSVGLVIQPPFYKDCF